MSISAPYFKIETFGAVDGPGVRLVVFLQGCPYRCIYCHNPESWSNKKTLRITTDGVLDLFNKNRTFYKNGGITLSGGEPLLHLDFCIELAKKCLSQKINLALDTSGCTFTKTNLRKFKQLIKYKPLWLVDIKQINSKKHRYITGVSYQYELDLIKFLERQHQKYWIRQVIVPGVTDDKKDLKLLGKFIKNLKWMTRFELLPYHKLAIKKYRELGIPYKIAKVIPPTKAQVAKAKSIIQRV